ncbi:hypothetical protein [Microbulbifer spongiae]|uniref:FHA domain-containing protein n=1 Tax=Microbulbifer spongiae TaxID=2944933 RepID=A0ABY9E9N3_9GAMM|nr:hypothetical protein [Microbulbifer sp. MI-G]WKD48798.1 hypothetical protein M8T91_12900 [Microbulbifer sp. MI-G]
MNYSIFNLPHEVEVKGVFGISCTASISDESQKAIAAGKLKISVMQQGEMACKDRFHFDISYLAGVFSIFVGNNDSRVIFSRGCIDSYEIRFWRSSEIEIGAGTSSNGTRIVCDNSKVKNGSDCMFSGEVLIQSADQHALVSLESGEILNKMLRVTTLGDHVWLGRNQH